MYWQLARKSSISSKSRRFRVRRVKSDRFRVRSLRKSDFQVWRSKSHRFRRKWVRFRRKPGSFRVWEGPLGWPLGTPKCVPVFSHTARSPEGEGISKMTLFRVSLARFPGNPDDFGSRASESQIFRSGGRKVTDFGSGDPKVTHFGVWRSIFREISSFGVARTSDRTLRNLEM